MRAFFILFFIISFGNYLVAQDLGQIGKTEPVKVSGGLNFSNIYYNSLGGPQRRDPNTMYLSGNLGLSIYGWNIPFTFNYTNRQVNFRQPFNQFSLNPYYKWVRLYLGNQSMSFSPYSLNGHLFLGAGAEFSPGKFSASVMYGRFQKAIEPDSTSYGNGDFERYGGGVKLGYSTEKGDYNFSVFHGYDVENSLDKSFWNPELLPQKNWVFQGGTTQRLLPDVSLHVEYARSIFTTSGNVKDTTENSSNVSINRKEEFSAYKASVAYNQQKYSLQLNYERIDPGYRSYGAYFFNNDLENITISGGVNLFNGKANITGNVGKQRNNLENDRVNQTERWVSAINIQFNPTQNWNGNVSYSNFSTFTNIRPEIDPFIENELDTLNFYQVNNSSQGSLNYNFGQDDLTHMVMFTGSVQKIKDLQNDEDTGNGSDFYTANANYRVNFRPLKLTGGLGYNYNRNEMNLINTETQGPVLSVSNSMLKGALRNTLSITSQRQYQNSQISSEIFSARFNVRITPEKLFMLKAKEEDSESSEQKQIKPNKKKVVYSETTGAALPAELVKKEEKVKPKDIEPKERKLNLRQSLSLSGGYVSRKQVFGENSKYRELTIRITYNISF
ncbi:hypothetical protein [Marinigracilibium pacificum]|uniref:Outer membrane protein beta-barrel domain-containing protein n=1 Tax=Marinigracilibium pacificum TaxID=2729599 RepID=A0A848JBV2_9BACT|nr:hypothetical protein [Marinigracilibium pacificum]NMM50482.1 hypothetical protein [Marinigracilibium pacificum]